MKAGAFREDRLLTAVESESLLHLMYDVAGEVKSGGSAIVRRARRRTDGTEVVLKLLSPSSADEQREVLEEARVLRRLCHENVVRLLDSFAISPDGVSSLTIPRRCLVLEACECSLADDVRDAWPGGLYEREDEVLTSRALDLCRGLNYVHKHGVAHRDLKAANVLLQDGVLKLADFGSAQQGDSRCSEAAGTVGYLAPELTRKDAYDASQRGMQLADRWALGIVLCELATGRLVHEWPWAGRNLASARRREKRNVISAAAAHCPAAAEVASRLLRQAPGRRIVLSKAMRLLAPPRAAPELSDGESTQSDTDERVRQKRCELVHHRS
jgi:serine/threonine protein kinase